MTATITRPQDMTAEEMWFKYLRIVAALKAAGLWPVPAR